MGRTLNGDTHRLPGAKARWLAKAGTRLMATLLAGRFLWLAKGCCYLAKHRVSGMARSAGAVRLRCHQLLAAQASTRLLEAQVCCQACCVSLAQRSRQARTPWNQLRPLARAALALSSARATRRWKRLPNATHTTTSHRGARTVHRTPITPAPPFVQSIPPGLAPGAATAAWLKNFAPSTRESLGI